METTNGLTMKELQRVKTLNLYEEEFITGKEAAERMNISERHFWRLCARYKSDGDVGQADRG